ncbi:hypothetical protein FOMPIDRAFT_60752 [Fomitopsis schrenkii]|uniref:Uncharacterized protein n=1 Tax=Fomitopsis schrenkii TaxID=2126942 RepID=S8DRT3_FOMSC|nr:hypothetical protein FOMPIDRAFT_60752 [Fomitopsis schrenkii]
MLWAAKNEEFLLEIPPDPPDSEDEDKQDELSSLYDFVEVCVPGPLHQQPNVPGHSTRSVPLILEEDDDEQYMEEDTMAGKILFTNQDMQEKWLRGRGKHVPRAESELQFCFGGDSEPASEPSPWGPFESEMEWCFASWAVKEGIKLSSIDNALEIPGFRERLGLSYHNTCSLLQRIDSLPERAEWEERWITFKDRPNKCHLLQFCDIIQAICTLLGNPEHTNRIVYRPRQLF